ELDAPGLDQVRHRVHHPVVLKVPRPSRLAGEHEYRPAPVAVTGHGEAVVVAGQREVDVMTVHVLIMADPSRTATHPSVGDPVRPAMRCSCAGPARSSGVRRVPGLAAP